MHEQGGIVQGRIIEISTERRQRKKGHEDMVVEREDKEDDNCRVKTQVCEVNINYGG